MHATAYRLIASSAVLAMQGAVFVANNGLQLAERVQASREASSRGSTGFAEPIRRHSQRHRDASQFKPLAGRSRRACRTLQCRARASSAPTLPSDIDTSDAVVVEQVPQGTLIIRPLRAEDVGAAAVCLTRGFANSADIADGRGYCQGVLQQAPNGLMLVGRLYPTDRGLLRKEQDSRLVATASLSFTRATREDFPSLQPPDDAAFLCNMAVDPNFRRQGYARRMLLACEALAAQRGMPVMYLHARLGDEPALSLYTSAGYTTADQDSWLVKLRGITPRALLRKALPPQPLSASPARQQQ